MCEYFPYKIKVKVKVKIKIETVDSALATRRGRHLASVGSTPPDYVVDLLGSAPTEWAQALRWRQGLAEIEDFRRKASFRASPDGPRGAWAVALGVPPEDWWEARPYRRVMESLRVVRRDLGLDQGELAPTAEAGGGAVGVLARSAPVGGARSGSPAGPVRAQRVRR